MTISSDLLALLRCPLDPTNGTLVQTETGLSCQRCQLVYLVREGIPCMLPEEAQLPPDCKHLDELPCRKTSPRSTS